MKTIAATIILHIQCPKSALSWPGPYFLGREVLRKCKTKIMMGVVEDILLLIDLFCFAGFGKIVCTSRSAVRAGVSLLYRFVITTSDIKDGLGSESTQRTQMRQCVTHIRPFWARYSQTFNAFFPGLCDVFGVCRFQQLRRLFCRWETVWCYSERHY